VQKPVNVSGPVCGRTPASALWLRRRLLLSRFPALQGMEHLLQLVVRVPAIEPRDGIEEGFPRLPTRCFGFMVEF